MAEDAKTEAPSGADLFRPSSEGGGFFRAKAGDMFVGEFKGVKDAGAQEFEGKKSRGIWWVFDLYKLADPSIRHRYTPEEGEDKGKEIDASADGRTTDETGPRSKARSWYTGLLSPETLSDEDFNTAEALARTYGRALGKRSLIVFGPSQNDATKIIVTQVLPFRGTD